MERNTLTLSVRLPDKLLADVTKYLIQKHDFHFQGKSSLVRDALSGFRSAIEFLEPDFEFFESTADARKFLEFISGSTFSGRQNKCSFEDQVISENSSIQREWKGQRNPMNKYSTAGEYKNKISLAENTILPPSPIAQEIQRTIEDEEQKERLKLTMSNTVQLVLTGAIPMSAEDRREFLLKNGMSEEEINSFDEKNS